MASADRAILADPAEHLRGLFGQAIDLARGMARQRIGTDHRSRVW